MTPEKLEASFHELLTFRVIQLLDFSKVNIKSDEKLKQTDLKLKGNCKLLAVVAEHVNFI
jgi:hypothetical protein